MITKSKAVALVLSGFFFVGEAKRREFVLGFALFGEEVFAEL